MGDYKISLKAARINAKLTRPEVAETLHVTARTIANWEADITSPTLVQTKELCELYHCPLDALSV